MPALQFAEIQTGRIEVIRRPAEYVCAAAGSLHVLLAPLLLVCVAWCARVTEPRLVKDLKPQAAPPENIPHEHLFLPGCQIRSTKGEARSYAALAYAPGGTWAIFSCGDRFVGHPAAAARQHRPAVAVACGAWRESLAADIVGGCGQHSGRVLDLAGWPQRWKRCATEPCAQAHSLAGCWVGGASRPARHFCSRRTSTTNSA